MTVADLWDRRALEFGRLAGTQDRIAKELEIRAIRSYVKPTPGQKYTVIDFGCGDGETLNLIARDLELGSSTLLGIDASREMLQMAIANAKHIPLAGRPYFCQYDMAAERFSAFTAMADLVYTERALINLTDWDTQARAIRNILGTVKPGGLFVMVENFQQPLRVLNALRESVGLETITPPAHNRYLDIDEVVALGFELHNDIHLAAGDAYVIERRHYSDAYYFLSRVVNAYQAHEIGVEPDYHSMVNQLALRLPAIDVPQCGQGQCWVWRKHGPHR